MSAGLLDKAVDHAETEACPRTSALRGVKRLKGMTLDLFGHSDARVRDGDQNVVPHSDFGVHQGVIAVENRRGDLDCQVAAVRHCVACVQPQVQESVLKLRDVDQGEVRAAVYDGGQFYGLAQGSGEQLRKVRD